MVAIEKLPKPHNAQYDILYSNLLCYKLSKNLQLCLVISDVLLREEDKVVKKQTWAFEGLSLYTSEYLTHTQYLFLNYIFATNLVLSDK